MSTKTQQALCDNLLELAVEPKYGRLTTYEIVEAFVQATVIAAGLDGDDHDLNKSLTLQIAGKAAGKLPARPDIVYANKGWKGWDDFLGVKPAK